MIALQYGDGKTNVPLIRRGIAWDSDREYKFRNPELGDFESLAAGMFIKAINFIPKHDIYIDILFHSFAKQNTSTKGLDQGSLGTGHRR